MIPLLVHASALSNSLRFTAVVEPTSAGIMKVVVNHMASRVLVCNRTNLV